MDSFLTQEEQLQIQSKYEDICDNMKQEELISKFFQANLISKNEKSALKHLSDPDKAQRIVDDVFLKATYNQICEIRKILNETRQPGHMAIAKLLPCRDKNDSYNPYRQPRLRKTSESVPAHMDDYVYEHRRGSDPGLFRPRMAVQESNRLSTGSDPDDRPESELYLAAGNPTSKDGIFKRMANSFRKKRTHKPSSPSSKPKLKHYEVKPGNDEVFGKTFCVIIANFTDDLEGYEKDIKDIVELHKNVLRSEYVYEGKIPGTDISLKNLTKKELFEVLLFIQNFLINPMSGNKIDRFFMYILSHGDEDGIMTCEKGSAINIEENIDPKSGKKIKVRTQMQEIIDLFTHEKVPNLKGFPKVFVNQSCKGGELLRAAGGTNEDTVDSAKEKVWEPPKAKLAIGADVMVCEATSFNNLSWVADRGSLYIQCLTDVIQEYFEEEHFYDILVEVNDRIAHKIKRGLNPNDNSIVPASQMPSIHSKLTRKFYLCRS